MVPWAAIFIYGESANPMRIHLQAPYRQGHLNRDQINYKEAISDFRITIEWLFGEIKTYLNFLTLKLNLKIALSYHVANIYLVRRLL